MLPKQNRLTKNKDFENIFASGLSLNSKLFKVSILKNNLHYNRYGIIISNKVSKKAVLRNKAKRQIKAIIQQNQGKIRVSFDIVIVTHPSIINAPFIEIKQTLAYLFHKLKIV